MKYTKKEYKKYVAKILKSFGKDVSISFEQWKKFQPFADKAVGIVNKVLNKLEKGEK